LALLAHLSTQRNVIVMLQLIGWITLQYSEGTLCSGRLSDLCGGVLETVTVIRWISFMLSCRSATANLGNVELCVALIKGFPQGVILSALFGSL